MDGIFYRYSYRTTADDNKSARCKMLWDSEFLYVYAEFKEQDIWATIIQHDMPVFQCFRIFINPDGSTFNYFEFQINANETVWDLFMPQPYRRRTCLSSWDIRGLKKAIHISGTLNNPADRIQVEYRAGNPFFITWYLAKYN